MTETTNRPGTDDPKADETFTWTHEASDDGDHSAKAGAAGILESVREIVDDLAERAAPTVRELSARAAELTAIAADKAAPLAKRAGEVTADASAVLATRSREWASGVRSAGATATAAPPVTGEDGTKDAPTPTDEGLPG
jgi:hypothetical protein